MKTFIKKLSRGSDFAVVIPEEVKRQYGLAVDQVVSFEVVRRDNGIVVLHKDATIESVEGDTEIVFSARDLSTRENDAFLDYEIYEYRIVSYSSIDDSEINIVTNYFDKMQMVTDSVFGMGDTDAARANQLVLDYNGALYIGSGYELGAGSVKFNINRNNDFIVPDDNLEVYNVKCVGFAPVVIEDSNWGNRLGFSIGDGSSDVLRYHSDESSEYMYIPSEFLQQTSSGEPVAPIFQMLKGDSWKYGVQFRYFENVYADEIGENAMGQLADFNTGTITTATYENVIDYFAGINLPRTQTVDTGNCETIGDLIGKYESQIYPDDNFPFFERNYYKTVRASSFKIRGILRNGVEIALDSSAGVIIDTNLNLVSQIQYWSNNVISNDGGYIRIISGDILLFDVVLTSKKVHVNIPLNIIDDASPNESSSSFGLVNVRLTDWGKRSGFETEFDCDCYFGCDLMSYDILSTMPKFVSETGQIPIGFTINSSIADSSWGIENLNDFRANTGENLYLFRYDYSANGNSGEEEQPTGQTFLQNCILSYDWILSGLNLNRSSDSQLESVDDLTLYPVFISEDPFEVEISFSSALNYSLNINHETDEFLVNIDVNYEVNTFGTPEVIDEVDNEADETRCEESSSSNGLEYNAVVPYKWWAVVDFGFGTEPRSLDYSEGYLTSGSYVVKCMCGTPFLAVGFSNVKDGNVKIEFVSWGSSMHNADSIFAGCYGKAAFEVPEWSDKITSAVDTYGMTEVYGNIPNWKNIVNADYAFRNSNVSGIIPQWGKVKSADATFFGCKNIYGIWDFTAPFDEIMPQDIIHSAYTVHGVCEGVRALFTTDWGGKFDSWASNQTSGNLNVVMVASLHHNNWPGNVKVHGWGWPLDESTGENRYVMDTMGRIYDSLSDPGPDGGAGSIILENNESYDTRNLVHPNCIVIWSNCSFVLPMNPATIEGFTWPHLEVSCEGVGIVPEVIVSTPYIPIRDHYPNGMVSNHGWKCPNTIKKIIFTNGWVVPSECCKNYEQLKRIEFVDSDYWLDLETECFSGCSALENVKLPVHSIGNLAFSNCTRLRHMVLTKSIESFGENCFQNVGADLDSDECFDFDVDAAVESERCITTIIEFSNVTRVTLRRNPEFIRNGFGAGSNVCFRCSDGDVVMINGTWNCEYQRLDLVSEPEHVEYEVVDYSNETFAIPRDTGLRIDAVYLCNGAELRENVTNSVHISPVNSATVDYCEASLTIGGVKHTVNIPVSISHVDITEVVSKSYVSSRAQLSEREFTAFECNLVAQNERGENEYDYGILVAKSNVRWYVTYSAVHENGLSSTFELDGWRRCYKGLKTEGPQLVGDIASGAQRFVLSAWWHHSAQNAFAFSTTDRLFGCECHEWGIRQTLDAYGTTHTTAEHRSIPYGFLTGLTNNSVFHTDQSGDTFYGKLDISRDNLVNVLVNDGISGNELHRCNCGSVSVWMPFRVCSFRVPSTELNEVWNRETPGVYNGSMTIPSPCGCEFTLMPTSGIWPHKSDSSQVHGITWGAKNFAWRLGLEFKNSYFPEEEDGYVAYWNNLPRRSYHVYLGQEFGGKTEDLNLIDGYNFSVSPGQITFDEAIKTYLYLLQNQIDKIIMFEPSGISSNYNAFVVSGFDLVVGRVRQNIPITVFFSGNSVSSSVINSKDIGYCDGELTPNSSYGPHGVCNNYEKIVPELKLTPWNHEPINTIVPNWVDEIGTILISGQLDEELNLVFNNEYGDECTAYVGGTFTDAGVLKIGGGMVYDVKEDYLDRSAVLSLNPADYRINLQYTHKDGSVQNQTAGFGIGLTDITNKFIIDQISPAPQTNQPVTSCSYGKKLTCQYDELRGEKRCSCQQVPRVEVKIKPVKPAPEPKPQRFVCDEQVEVDKMVKVVIDTNPYLVDPKKRFKTEYRMITEKICLKAHWEDA